MMNPGVVTKACKASEINLSSEERETRDVRRRKTLWLNGPKSFCVRLWGVLAPAASRRHVQAVDAMRRLSRRSGTSSAFTSTRPTSCRAVRAREFRKFLDGLIVNVPDGLDIHVVIDNASTYKTRLIRRLVRQMVAEAHALHGDIVVMAQPSRMIFGAANRQTAQTQCS